MDKGEYMNLFEELINADKRIIEELSTKQILSDRLSTKLGRKVYITIKELDGKRLNDIVGRFRTSSKKNKTRELKEGKEYDLCVAICAEGIIDPPVANAELQEAYGCATAEELVEKLFKSEASSIADAISEFNAVSEAENEAQEDGTTLDEKLKN